MFEVDYALSLKCNEPHPGHIERCEGLGLLLSSAMFGFMSFFVVKNHLRLTVNELLLPIEVIQYFGLPPPFFFFYFHRPSPLLFL